MRNALLVFGLILTLFQSAKAQEEHFSRHRIAPLVGYIFVPEQRDYIEEKAFSIIPAIGLDYEYRVTEKWGIGSYNDIELTNYYIVTDDNSYLERERVFITAVCVFFEVGENMSAYAGGGYEMDVHENFFVYRAGVEYKVDIRKGWDTAFGLSFDFKEVYKSFGFTIAFGKKFDSIITKE